MDRGRETQPQVVENLNKLTYELTVNVSINFDGLRVIFGGQAIEY